MNLSKSNGIVNIQMLEKGCRMVRNGTNILEEEGKSDSAVILLEFLVLPVHWSLSFDYIQITLKEKS